MEKLKLLFILFVGMLLAACTASDAGYQQATTEPAPSYGRTPPPGHYSARDTEYYHVPVEHDYAPNTDTTPTKAERRNGG